MADENIRDGAYVHVADLDASINDTDKIYRNVASRRLIKVRCVRVDPPSRETNLIGKGFGMVVVQISGAMCGEDGKALAHPSDETAFQVAPAQRHTFQSDVPIDLATHLELKRLEVVAATERAADIERDAINILPR